jgi:hypothetical protein
MFAVTQEDFVHSMAVIELLWRSCCRLGEEGGTGGDLSTRLKVRQWANLLLDRSLLLGSSSKGVHLRDIVLAHLRKTRPATELRALHARVVEGLVAASTERTAATGRGRGGRARHWQALAVSRLLETGGGRSRRADPTASHGDLLLLWEVTFQVSDARGGGDMWCWWCQLAQVVEAGGGC